MAPCFVGMWLSRDFVNLTITAAVNGIGMTLMAAACVASALGSRTKNQGPLQHL
jgi:hypothetical protein